MVQYGAISHAIIYPVAQRGVLILLPNYTTHVVSALNKGGMVHISGIQCIDTLGTSGNNLCSLL